MNKIFYCIRNVMFALVVILFAVFSFKLNIIGDIFAVLVYALLIVLMVTFIVQHLKKIMIVINNNQFNITTTLAMTYIVIVFIRNLLDNSFIIKLLTGDRQALSYLQSTFLSGNLLFIVLIMLWIFVYNFLLVHDKKKQIN